MFISMDGVFHLNIFLTYLDLGCALQACIRINTRDTMRDEWVILRKSFQPSGDHFSQHNTVEMSRVKIDFYSGIFLSPSQLNLEYVCCEIRNVQIIHVVLLNNVCLKSGEKNYY